MARGVQRADAYADYAAVYDATGQGRGAALQAEQALAWLRARDRAPRDALDLACGTGAATIALARAGVRVIGIDRSPAMLSIARGRARDSGLSAAFVRGDIRDLMAGDGPGAEPLDPMSDGADDAAPLALRPASVDLVTCFGALEELTDDGDLARVFSGAARLLRPGGHLIFDLPRGGLPEGDEVLHDGPDHLVYAHTVCDRRGRFGRRRVVWFVREIERWWRGEMTYGVRSWRGGEVSEALGASGLRLIERSSGSDGLRERVRYVASR
ncbi:MAG: class I SAM-dependent methyltransferase [Chloroflexota bacterium]|nr:MAG: class I SAM-dependent methyltransferase [Chloroflexota bacterium]